MFYGTTPQIISQYLKDAIPENVPQSWVLFAGNFVVEQILAQRSAKIIHSTDISLYSRAIGFGLTDKRSDIKPNSTAIKTFPVLETLKTPIEIAAGVIFMTEMASHLKKNHVAYYANLVRDGKANAEIYLKKILDKLTKINKAIGHMKFHGDDACNHINKIQPGDFVFYDPPVISGDYEKMFAPLEEMYDFTPEPYTVITEEMKFNQLEQIHESGAIAYYRTNNPITPPKNYKETFRYKYRKDAEYCIYTNKRKKIFVGTASMMTEEARKYKMMGDNDEITHKTKIQVIQTKNSIGNHYRMMWVKKAEMTNGGIPFLILADGMIIGMAQIKDGTAMGHNMAIIFSDPASPLTQYARLSKLIIDLICTHEFLEMFNNITMWEHTGFSTKVFTNYKVSMKYRNKFDLTDREELKTGNYRYKLTYQNRNKILPTYRAALTQWVNKYAKIR